VKVRKSGIPSFLPTRLCLLVHETKRNLKEPCELNRAFKALLSLISIFRSMSGHHKIKFDTVTNPHNGEMLTLNQSLIQDALKSLRLKKLVVKKPEWFLSSKSGVNSSSAFLSIALDTMA